MAHVVLFVFALTATFVCGGDLRAADPQVAELLATIGRAGPQGSGSAEARAARDELATRGLEILPDLLEAMDTPNVVAANWYRTIYEVLTARAFARSDTVWPRKFLHQYADDVRRTGRARRLIVALVDRLEPGFRDAWLPTRLGDPEFGYEAVALALDAGAAAFKAKDTEKARDAYRKAFEAARDSRQVSTAAAKLKALGEEADAVRHLGLVVDWRLIGPFDAPDRSGFAATFPPEEQLDLAATYVGQAGQTLAWKWHRPKDVLGQVNLNEVLGATREAVGYAYAELDVPAAVKGQVRCGADDNCTVWLNGEQVLAREQWLNGTRFDRFRAPINLKPGRNTLLVKVCQGPQHKDPEVPNNWSLQLRLCDADGRALDFTTVTEPTTTETP